MSFVNRKGFSFRTQFFFPLLFLVLNSLNPDFLFFYKIQSSKTAKRLIDGMLLLLRRDTAA